jgi:hypothetical protein
MNTPAGKGLNVPEPCELQMCTIKGLVTLLMGSFDLLKGRGNCCCHYNVSWASQALTVQGPEALKATVGVTASAASV